MVQTFSQHLRKNKEEEDCNSRESTDLRLTLVSWEAIRDLSCQPLILDSWLTIPEPLSIHTDSIYRCSLQGWKCALGDLANEIICEINRDPFLSRFYTSFESVFSLNLHWFSIYSLKFPEDNPRVTHEMHENQKKYQKKYCHASVESSLGSWNPMHQSYARPAKPEMKRMLNELVCWPALTHYQEVFSFLCHAVTLSEWSKCMKK